MAKKRRSFKKAKTRTVTKYKNIARKSKKGLKKVFNDLPLVSAGYGLVRNDLANAFAPLTQKMPFGDYNDELALGIGAYLLSNVVKGSKPIMSKVIDAEAYTMGLMARSNFGNNTKTNNDVFVYG